MLSTLANGAITDINNEVMTFKLSADHSRVSVYSNDVYKGAYNGPGPGQTFQVNLTASGGTNALLFDDSSYNGNMGYYITTNQSNQEDLIIGPIVNQTLTAAFEFTLTNNLFAARSLLPAAGGTGITDDVAIRSHSTDPNGVHDLNGISTWGVQGDSQVTTNLHLSDVDSPSANTYQITSNYVNLPNTQHLVVLYANISNLDLYTGTKANTVNVDSTALTTHTIIHGNGPGSTYNIGNGDLNTVRGLVSVSCFYPGDVVVNDQSSLDPTNTYGITSKLLGRANFGGLEYTNARTLTLKGDAAANVYYIIGTSTQTNLNPGAGNATFNIGLGNLNDLAGHVTLNGNGGTNSVVVNDYLASVNDPYTITSNTVTRNGFGGLTFAGVQNLTLDGASTGNRSVVIGGGDLTNLSSVTADASLGSGNLVYEDHLGNVHVTVNCSSFGVVLDDHLANYSNAYTITSSSVTRNGFAGLTYNNLQGVTLDGANTGNYYFVASTSVPTTLNSGGDDSIFVIGSDGNLDAIGGSVTVNGQGANNSVSLDDHGSNFHGTYSITSNSVTRIGFGGLTYGNVQSLGLTGSQGGDVYNVVSTSAPTSLCGTAGSNAFNIGTGILNNVLGPVSVHALGDGNTTFFDDHLSGIGNQYVFGSGSVTTVGGLGFGGLTFTGIQNMILNASGNCVFDIGTGDLDKLPGSLTIHSPGAYNQYVIDDQLTGQGHTFTVTGNTITRAGGPVINYDGGLNVTLRAGNHGNTINVLGENTMPGAALEIDAGAAGDTINVTSSTHTIDPFIGNTSPLTVVDSYGASSLNVDDSGFTGNESYYLDGNRFGVGRAGVNNIFVIYSGVANVTYSGGSGRDSFQIVQTRAKTTVSGGAGYDTFDVGYQGSLDLVAAPLTIQGNGGAAAVVLDDHNSWIKNFTITANSVTRDGGTFAGLTYLGVQNLTVGGGYAGDVFNVLGTSAATILNGSDGNNAFNIGSGNLDSLQGAVSVNGSGGTDSVVLDDHLAGYNGAYTITSNSVTRNGFGGLTYGNVQDITLIGSKHGDVYDVTSTSVPTRLTSGGGPDTFNLGTGDLGSLQGPVTVNGSGGSGVVLDDRTAGYAVNYAITANSVTRNGFGGLTYGGLRNLTLDGANIVSWYFVGSTSVPTILNSGGNNSIFVIGIDSIVGIGTSGNLDNLAGPVTVNGRGANNSVGIDDDASGFKGTYTITANSVTRSGFGGLAYGNVQYMSLLGAKSGDVYNVFGTSAQTNLDSGGSHDVFNVMNLSNLVAAYGSGASNTAQITWALPTAISYGTPLSTGQLDATASVPGTLTYTPALGTVLRAGHQVLSVAFTPADLTQFKTVTEYVPLLVTPAATQVAIASSADPSISGQLVTFSATVSAQTPSGATPTGSVQFQVDGADFGSPVSLDATGKAISPGIALGAGTHVVTAVYVNTDGNCVGSSGTLVGGQQVNPVTAANLQGVLATTSTPAVDVATDSDLQTVVTAVNGLTAPPNPVTVTVNVGTTSLTDVTASPPPGVTLELIGTQGSTVIVGHSPALVVTAGSVIIENTIFTTATNAPTILVNGGRLTLRNDDIEESTGFAQAAVAVTGGTLDLGTADDPGRNVLNVNGPGQFLQGTTAGGITAIGDTLEVGGTALPASRLSLTALTTSASPSIYGQSIQLTATVTPVDDSVPTGSVAFVDASTGTALGTAPVRLVNGLARAVLNTSSLVPGSHTITATYGGDRTFAFSPASLTQVVNPAPLTATGRTFTALAGFPFTGVVATFANADPFGGTASYAATIAWGDRTTSYGTITADPSGVFAVVGSHTYAGPQTHAVSVTIQHLQGYTTPANATSTAVVVENTGLLLLDPTGKGALNASGGASVVLTNSGVVDVDSSNAASVLASGSAHLQAAEFDLHGAPGYQATGGASLHGTIYSGVSLSQLSMQVPADLAALPAPTPAAHPITGANYGGVTTVTLQPGTYAGITVSGQASVTLAPGVYYLTSGLSVSGAAQLSGQDVVLYFASGSSLSLSGIGKLTLTPPTSGAYQGVVIFAARSSAVPLSITGSASLLFSGTIYAPASPITVSGAGSVQGFNAQVIAADLNDSGSGLVQIQANAFNRQVPLGDVIVFATGTSGSTTGQFSVGNGPSTDPSVTDLALLNLMQHFSSNAGLAADDDALGLLLADLAASKQVGGKGSGVLDLLFSGTW